MIEGIASCSTNGISIPKQSDKITIVQSDDLGILVLWEFDFCFFFFGLQKFSIFFMYFKQTLHYNRSTFKFRRTGCKKMFYCLQPWRNITRFFCFSLFYTVYGNNRLGFDFSCLFTVFFYQ